MNVSQALDDIKAWLEGDPLVQAAVNLVVPVSTRPVLADILRVLESEFAHATQAAVEADRAAAVAQQEIPQP